METSMGRRCSICNAIISDDNPDGIGFSCREAYNKAKWKWYSRIDENRFNLWKLEVSYIMTEFIQIFDGKKFRSAFRKEFYPSICNQYREKGYISKKQLEICTNWLRWENHEKLDNLLDCIYENKKNIVDGYMNDFFEYGENNEIIEFRELVNRSRQYTEEET